MDRDGARGCQTVDEEIVIRSRVSQVAQERVEALAKVPEKVEAKKNMNETHFLSCFSLIVETHNCQMIVGDGFLGFSGDQNQKEKCAEVMETILGYYLQPDIPEVVLGWPV